MLAFILAVATVFALAFAYKKHVAAKQAHDKADAAQKKLDDKLVVLSDVEVMRLAKTGCKGCFGAGHRRCLNERGEPIDALCTCVVKKMLYNPAYRWGPDGTPCRVLTMEERLRLEEAKLVNQTTFGAMSHKGGAQC